MALPSKPLEIQLDANALTIGDARLLTGRIDTNNIELIAQFGQFLIAHTNWSEVEVDRIKGAEMLDVVEQVKARFAESTVPNPNGASSGNSPA